MNKGTKGCKLFIGGLPRSFPDAQFREIFAAFGPLVDCVVMRDREGTPRGFGYVTFQNAADAEKVMSQKELKIYGKVVDVKYAVSKADMARQERGQLVGVPPVRTSKVFVGGLAHQTTKETFRTYFSQFGHITDSVVMATKMEGRGRGFGFVTFESADVAEEVLSRTHIIDGKQVDCQKADGLRPPRSSVSPVPLYSSYGFELPSRFPPLLPLTDPRFPVDSSRGIPSEAFETKDKRFIPRERIPTRDDREEYDRTWQRWAGWDPYTQLAARPWGAAAGTWPQGRFGGFPPYGGLEVYPQHVLPPRGLPLPLQRPISSQPDSDSLSDPVRPQSLFRTPYLQGSAAINVSGGRSAQPWNPELGGTRLAAYSHFDGQPQNYRTGLSS